MYELKPMNKYVWLEPITAENKVGSLYVVSHSQNSFQLGTVRAFAECDETKGLTRGATVLYDSLGAQSHRVGNQSITTVKAVNILGIVVKETVVAYDPSKMSFHVVPKDHPNLVDPATGHHASSKVGL